MFTIFWAFLMVEKSFLSLQVKGNSINLYVRVAERLKTLDFRELGIAGKSQNFIDLAHSPSLEIKICQY